MTQADVLKAINENHFGYQKLTMEEFLEFMQTADRLLLIVDFFFKWGRSESSAKHAELNKLLDEAGTVFP